jgi:hypothetical protein
VDYSSWTCPSSLECEYEASRNTSAVVVNPLVDLVSTLPSMKALKGIGCVFCGGIRQATSVECAHDVGKLNVDVVRVLVV